LILGTRGSALALAQSRQVAAQLEAAHPGLKIEERVIRTSGDKQQGQPLPAIGGKGVFTQEIESALLNGEIDFAVHSLKDLPPDMPAGLCLAAVPQRASATDVLIQSIARNPQSAMQKVGTSSLRRRALLRSLHPDWQIEDVRGNIDTRLRKLEGGFDAIVLARAGLQRLQIEEQLKSRMEELDPAVFIPAPGQGALAIQARSDDESTLGILEALEDDATRAAIIAERAVVRVLDAGCSTPLGAYATCDNGVLSLRACVLSPDGTQRIDAQGKSVPDLAADLGNSVTQKLLDQGAKELLA
jgi:hydroxymethylbilane synthase